MRLILLLFFLSFSCLNPAAAQGDMKMSPEVAHYIEMKEALHEEIVRGFIHTVQQQNIEITELKKEVAKYKAKERRQKQVRNALWAFSSSTIGTLIIILLLL